MALSNAKKSSIAFSRQNGPVLGMAVTNLGCSRISLAAVISSLSFSITLFSRWSVISREWDPLSEAADVALTPASSGTMSVFAPITPTSGFVQEKSLDNQGQTEVSLV